MRGLVAEVDYPRRDPDLLRERRDWCGVYRLLIGVRGFTGRWGCGGMGKIGHIHRNAESRRRREQESCGYSGRLETIKSHNSLPGNCWNSSTSVNGSEQQTKTEKNARYNAFPRAKALKKQDATGELNTRDSPWTPSAKGCLCHWGEQAQDEASFAARKLGAPINPRKTWRFQPPSSHRRIEVSVVLQDFFYACPSPSFPSRTFCSCPVRQLTARTTTAL